MFEIISWNLSKFSTTRYKTANHSEVLFLISDISGGGNIVQIVGKSRNQVGRRQGFLLWLHWSL